MWTGMAFGFHGIISHEANPFGVKPAAAVLDRAVADVTGNQNLEKLRFELVFDHLFPSKNNFL